MKYNKRDVLWSYVVSSYYKYYDYKVTLELYDVGFFERLETTLTSDKKEKLSNFDDEDIIDLRNKHLCKEELHQNFIDASELFEKEYGIMFYRMYVYLKNQEQMNHYVLNGEFYITKFPIELEQN